MIGYILLVLWRWAWPAIFGPAARLGSLKGHQQALHSRPSYHGAYVAAWVGIPSLLSSSSGCSSTAW